MVGSLQVLLDNWRFEMKETERSTESAVQDREGVCGHGQRTLTSSWVRDLTLESCLSKSPFPMQPHPRPEFSFDIV